MKLLHRKMKLRPRLPTTAGSCKLYTDGSFHANTLFASAWAVTMAADRWLDENYACLPSDEQHLSAAQVSGVTLIY